MSHTSVGFRAISDPRGVSVLKLGGALITGFKNGEPVVRREIVVRCAREIASYGNPVVVVHGTGAFGKPPAVRYGYLGGCVAAARSDVVARVAAELARLELGVIECLLEGGLRPLRVSAVGLFRSVDGLVLRDTSHAVVEALERGVTPVIGGNFVFDSGGFAVCSSDVMATDIAVNLDARSLVMATSAHGVYRTFGKNEEIFSSISSSDCGVIGSSDEDVSGGMREKVAMGFRALQGGVRTYIVDGRLPGNVLSALHGYPVCGTRLVSGTNATMANEKRK